MQEFEDVAQEHVAPKLCPLSCQINNDSRSLTTYPDGLMEMPVLNLAGCGLNLMDWGQHQGWKEGAIQNFKFKCVLRKICYVRISIELKIQHFKFWELLRKV